ncbi:MAG: imidazole glycerol phosphate synthase cyclase subunit, partial [Patescibacteria group bacterium]
MLKKRLIPILLLREGMLVKSIEFQSYRPVGNPKVAIDYFNSWEVDEIVFLDITPGKQYQPGRLDINLENFRLLSDYTRYISTKCFVPLTVGGGITTIDDIRNLLHAGADKISINTQAISHPEFITAASKIFGRQCIVVSIDVKKTNSGYEVFTSYGKKATGINPIKWAKEAVERGAGEILLQSMDKDGTLSGYDLELIKSVADSVSAPVIATSGVGNWQHLVDGIKVGHASAVAA